MSIGHCRGAMSVPSYPAGKTEALYKIKVDSKAMNNVNTTAPDSNQAARPVLPDHLCTDPRSLHYVAAVFEHDIGIRFNGKERSDVAEYCISEGWVKVPAGKTLDRKGQPLLIKLKGKVEAFYQ